MSETSQLQYCAECGAVLSGYAADRLCAACLLESAILEPEKSADARVPVTPLLAFNDYELLEEIARGGMGVVYRARQISLNRTVAIKMILGGHLANVAEMKRFRAEAETAAQLQHPNIVAIHEVGEHAGQPFFSMDLVAGRNLAQLVRDEPLPSRKAAGYLKTIAVAIQYAHSRGVLHRDLKPSNILIDEKDQPRITDFGLAKRLTDPQLSTNDPQLTQTGQVLGSPSFIPPEQAAGQKANIGPASDVYSLGAILYHCLAGRPPFVAESLTQTLRMVAEQEPVSPRLLNASVPRDLETICLKCLEKEPSRRYTTPQELADELDRFLRNEPIHARPISLVLKVHRWCVRNKPLAISGTAILALLLVVAIGSPIAAFRINRERQTAETALARELVLRNRAEARAKIPRAKMLQRDGKESEAEKLLNEIPISFVEPDATLAQMRRKFGWKQGLRNNWQQAVANFAVLERLHELASEGMFETDEAGDTASLDSLLYGTSLIELGDTNAYESFCQSLVSRNAQTTNPVIAERVCKVSLLVPAGERLLAALAPLYDVAAHRQAYPESHFEMKNWAYVSLALADYRRGQYSKAVEWSQQCLSPLQTNPPRTATAQIILAMSKHRIGREPEARSQLATAAAAVAAAFRAGGQAYGDRPEYWYFDWIFARILLREAVVLIGNPPADAKQSGG